MDLLQVADLPLYFHLLPTLLSENAIVMIIIFLLGFPSQDENILLLRF